MNSDQPGLGAPEELESGSPVAEPSHSQAEENAEVSPADVPSMSGRSVEAIAADEVLAAMFAETADEPESDVDEPDEAPEETSDFGDFGEEISAVDTEEAALPTSQDEAQTAPPALSEPQAAQSEKPGSKRPQRGEIIEAATVIETAVSHVVVDLGDGLRGVIPGRELERMSRKMVEELAVGVTVPVFVIQQRDPNGDTIVSVNRAVEEMDWRDAERYRESQEVYESRVAGYNKGGLIVRFGRVRGFVPQSQLSMDRRRALEGQTPEERWGGMVNEAIAVKVMEVDRARNRLILSERAASREAREKRKEALVGELGVGEIRTGRVVSLEDFGAFVDVGGAEGLVHLTELSWKHLTHPREMLAVGQEVQVEIISVDRNQKRIGLSMRRLERDPWDAVAIDFEVGQLVRGRVTKLTKFGAFAQLVDVPEVEGLIHISELSDQRVKHPREVVNEGDIMTLRIVKMDIKDRRLGLSLKAVNSAEYLDSDLSRFAAEAQMDEEGDSGSTSEERYDGTMEDTYDEVMDEDIEATAAQVTEGVDDGAAPDVESDVSGEEEADTN
ncbi:MAG: S1 RNA-binding domain-containing protein [Burkholderiales bacterium]|nr:S1 RNA-binding domain-containing protein [Anaerolineae bacterium]